MSHSSSTSPMHHLSPFNASLASPSTKIPVAFNSIEIDKSTSSNIDHILGNIKVDPDSYHRQVVHCIMCGNLFMVQAVSKKVTFYKGWRI